MAFRVVVEVDVDVATFVEPPLGVCGPRAQRLLAIARGVLARVTVEANVDEVRRHFLPHREVGRVAHAHRDVVRAHDCGDLVGEPRLVAQLERVADIGPRFERTREILEPCEAALTVRRQLPHDGAELFAQRRRLVAESHDRIAAVFEALVVRDEPVALEREAKVLGRLAVPARVGLGFDLRVERAVDLERVESARCDLEPFLERRVRV